MIRKIRIPRTIVRGLASALGLSILVLAASAGAGAQASAVCQKLCDGTVTAFSNNATSFTTQGTYTINWIYKDAAGNSLPAGAQAIGAGFGQELLSALRVFMEYRLRAQLDAAFGIPGWESLPFDPDLSGWRP